MKKSRPSKSSTFLAKNLSTKRTSKTISGFKARNAPIRNKYFNYAIGFFTIASGGVISIFTLFQNPTLGTVLAGAVAAAITSLAVSSRRHESKQNVLFKRVENIALRILYREQIKNKALREFLGKHDWIGITEKGNIVGCATEKEARENALIAVTSHAVWAGLYARNEKKYTR